MCSSPLSKIKGIYEDKTLWDILFLFIFKKEDNSANCLFCKNKFILEIISSFEPWLCSKFFSWSLSFKFMSGLCIFGISLFAWELFWIPSEYLSSSDNWFGLFVKLFSIDFEFSFCKSNSFSLLSVIKLFPSSPSISSSFWSFLFSINKLGSTVWENW